jgi:hypothetical protein
MRSTDRTAGDAVIDRFERIDLRRPRIDRTAVERALRQHLCQVDDDPTRAIRWFQGAFQAFRYILKVECDQRVSPVFRKKLAVLRKETVRELNRAGSTASDLEVEAVLSSRITRVLDRRNANIAKGVACVKAQMPSSPGRGPSQDAEHTDGHPGAFVTWWLASRDSCALDPIDGAARYASVLNMMDRLKGTRIFRGDNRRINEILLRYAKIWRPLADAAEAGLFVYWIAEGEIVCVPRPALFTVSGRLHRPEGPAIRWTDADSYYFWDGHYVSRKLVEQPEAISIADVGRERRPEIRRLLIERVGYDRLTAQLRAPAAIDRCGKLWRCLLVEDRTTLAIVEVENGTVNPDGSRSRYFLRVPPSVQTPHEAVAWTYGLEPAQYQPVVRS